VSLPTLKDKGGIFVSKGLLTYFREGGGKVNMYPDICNKRVISIICEESLAMHDEWINVPQIQTQQFLAWIVQLQPCPILVFEGQQLVQYDNLQTLAHLVAQAYNQHCAWILLDGPRQSRPCWLLDPWWEDQPEMSPALQTSTHAHCVALESLYQALQEKSGGSAQAAG
jgi:hypothetical protein